MLLFLESLPVSAIITATRDMLCMLLSYTPDPPIQCCGFESVPLLFRMAVFIADPATPQTHLPSILNWGVHVGLACILVDAMAVIIADTGMAVTCF